MQAQAQPPAQESGAATFARGLFRLSMLPAILMGIIIVTVIIIIVYVVYKIFSTLGNLFGLSGAKGGGVGKIGNCADDQESNAGLCYTKCRDGYKGVATMCVQVCPPGFKDDGLYCRPTTTRVSDHSTLEGCERVAGKGNCVKKGLLFYPKCPAGYARDAVDLLTCRQTCPSGMKNIGVSCQKSTYDRGAGKVPSKCPAGQDMIAGLCYPACPEGYYRDLGGKGLLCKKST